MGESRLVNKNVAGASGRTSIRLEPELWDALEEICRREGMSMTEIVRLIEARSADAGQTGGRTSAVRVYIVGYFRAAPARRAPATGD